MALAFLTRRQLIPLWPPAWRWWPPLRLFYLYNASTRHLAQSRLAYKQVERAPSDDAVCSSSAPHGGPPDG